MGFFFYIFEQLEAFKYLNSNVFFMDHSVKA